MTLVLLAAVFSFFKATKIGKAMRATAGNRRGASVVGIRVGQTVWSQNSYYNGTSSIAIGTGASSQILMGTGQFAFYTAPSVTAGAAQTFTEVIHINLSGTASTSTTTGALVVSGGVGVAGALYASLASSATSSIVYFNTGTGAITYGAVSGLISAGNGLSYSSGVMSLGNTLTATATITATSTFQLSIVGVNTTALNASNYPFISTGYITTTGTETAQYASAGVYAALHMDTASGTFTPFANSKHAGLSATVYKTSAGIYAGILPAVLGTMEFAGSGNVTTAAALRALYPALTSGQTYTGTITNAVGLYIDDFSLTSGLTITNKYSIYQAGATDMNYFNGNITMNGAITMASGSNKSIGQSQLSAGTVTVSNSRATASSILIVTRKTPLGTLGFLSYTVSSGTFTINSSNASDTSFVIWTLLN